MAVKLLKNTKEDVVIPESANITLEIPENVTLTNASGHTITNNGTFKLTGGQRLTTRPMRGALVNYGTAVLEGTTLTRSAEASTSATDNGGNSRYVIYNGGEMTITGTTDVVNKGHYSSLICNKGESAESPRKPDCKRRYNRAAELYSRSRTMTSVSSRSQAARSAATIRRFRTGPTRRFPAVHSTATSPLGLMTAAPQAKTVISGTAVITGNVMAVNSDNQDTIPTVVIQGGTVNGKLKKATYNNGIVPADPSADLLPLSRFHGSFSEAVGRGVLCGGFPSGIKTRTVLSPCMSMPPSVG